MPSESIPDELLSLLEDTREHFAYLQELGVQSVEEASGEPSAPVFQASSASAQAGAEPPRAPLAQPPLATKQTPQSQTFQRPPASSTKKIETAPGPRDTLFGDIFAKEEDRLPESSESFEQIQADVGNCTRCQLCHG